MPEDLVEQGRGAGAGRALSLVVRPGIKHKFRLVYEPISYSASTTLARPIVFDGQAFASGATVATSVDWKSWKFGYEYDFIYHPRFFAGFILEARHDTIDATLSDATLTGRSHARTPFPMIGGIIRLYPLPDLSLTTEFTGMTFPSSWRDATGYGGHAYDLDLYATFNFSNNLGIRSGYRSTKVYYEWEGSHDELGRRGPYVMGLVRF